MDIFIISDSHFGHDKMVKWSLRPDNFEEKIWKGLEALPENCVLIHCGDLTMGSDAMTHMKLSGYKFRKWLIRGNHDNHPISWYLRNGWDFCGDELVINIYGHRVLFSHMPLPKRGGITKNIHGHLHGGKSTHGVPDFYDETYHFEVTPEVVGYHPVQLSQKM